MMTFNRLCGGENPLTDKYIMKPSIDTQTPVSSQFRTTRRPIIRAVVGAGALGVLGVSPFASTVAAGSADGSLVGKIASNGYWTINHPDPDPAEGLYRSKNPFSLTWQDDSAEVSPKDGGVEMNVDSTYYSDAGCYLRAGQVGNIETVTVVSSGDQVGISLWLDTSGDGDFLAWEKHNGNTEQATGLGGDLAKHGGVLGTGEATVEKDGRLFGGKTIEEWASTAGPTTQAAIWIGVIGPGSKTSTVESVEIDTA
jgi:hypothetical protein